MNDATAIAAALGGVGGVYFLAEPGELVVEVAKRDRNERDWRTELRALLVGPDRRVLAETTIPDDRRPRGSGLGPVQQARLSARVERKGVYVLNVTVSQDRYGEETLWGFRTNCPRYLIETSRGHRDARHEEPIVLANPHAPGDVCFLPRDGAFGIEITEIPADVKALPVYDARSTLIQELPVDATGRASGVFAATARREHVPWRLHLPRNQAKIQIDGVTRWDDPDRCPDLPYWTPDPASWFPFLEYRWLLTPYQQTVYGPPGQEGECRFQVHNNAGDERTVRLEIAYPNGAWPARLSQTAVVVAAKQSAEVGVRYTVPAEGESRSCHVRATPEQDPGFSTYATLTVQAGPAPATQPLAMPIVLQPYAHENEQFGYLPDYPTENQVYFDRENRPFIRTSSGVATCRDGRWITADFQTAVTERPPALAGVSFGMPSTKIAFDRENDLYLVATGGGQAAVLRSTDRGTTFAADVIPGGEDRPRSFDIEQFSGHNLPEGPPPILRYTLTERDPQRIWRRVHDLELFLPRKEHGRLVIGEPVLLSRRCIGLAAHSGIPASIVSRGSKVHVAWGEATEPDEPVAGVPSYVATYDRTTGRLGKPALVGYGAPPNDIHNTPSITMDSQGSLHILAGTHGRPFPYARSLQPDDTHAGWTAAAPAGEGLGQTYIGLVCGPDDTLHMVCRLWRTATDPFPASSHATLAYQRKPPGQPWEEPRILVVAPFSEYSIFYHRLTIDRAGRLFLSYDYWSTFWFYRTDHRGSRRALLISADGGQTWKLAETDDMWQKAESRRQ